MNKLLLISTLLLASPVFAASGKIYQLHLNQHRVFATLNATVPEGTTVSVNFGKGQQCVLLIKKIDGVRASLDSTGCAFERKLYVGQQIAEIARPTAEAPAVSPLKNYSAGNESDLSATVVTDAQYIPAKGHFSVQGLGGYVQQTSSISAGGNKYTDNTGKQNTAAILLNYSFTKMFAAGVNFAIGARTGDTTYGPASILNGQTTSYTENGGTDPAVQLNLRALDQSDFPVTLDTTLIYSPNSGAAKRGNSTANGNMLRGGDQKTLRVTTGRKDGKIQYTAEFDYSMYGTQTTSSSGNPDSNYDASTAIQLGGTLQFELTNKLFLRGALAEYSFGTQGVSQSGTTILTLGSYYQTLAGLGVEVAVIPKRLAAAISYFYMPNATTTGTFSGLPASSTSGSSQLTMSVTADF